MVKTEKHKDETGSLLNSLLPSPANMEAGAFTQNS